MTWKRTVANIIGDAFQIRFARKGRCATLVEEDILARFLHEFAIDCVFDVGANAGQYARRLRQSGYRGEIVSVEPIPRLAAQLRVDAARDPHWFVEAIALDESEADVTFNVMASSVFSSLKRPNSAQTNRFDSLNVVAETVEVHTQRLDALYDAYVAKLGFARPFLKMDTQGNDLAVARGAGNRLRLFAGLQSELSFTALYEQQSGYREVLDFYESAGFILTNLMPAESWNFPALIEADCIMFNPAFTPQAYASLTYSRAQNTTHNAS